MKTQIQYPRFHDYQTVFLSKFADWIRGEEFLFRVNVSADALEKTFLESFSGKAGDEGGFGMRQYMNCRCCKQFVRRYGNLVKININSDGIPVIKSFWDFESESYAEDYQIMTQRMSQLVYESSTVTDVFVPHEELKNDLNIGIISNTKLIEGGIVVFNHFAGTLTQQVLREARKKAREADTAVYSQGSVLNFYRSLHTSFLKGCSEIDLSVAQSLLEFVSSGNLPSYNQFKGSLETFLPLLETYKNFQDSSISNLWAWRIVTEVPGIARFPNSLAGQLLKDLTEKEDSKAFKDFIRRVDPTNYQQKDITLVTPKQISAAEKTVKELGLADSLFRRHVVSQELRLSDLGEWFWINRASRKAASPDSLGVFEALKQEFSTVDPNRVNGTEISLQDFLSNLGTNIDILFSNDLTSKLVSLIGAQNPDAPVITNHGNHFTWAYQGGLTDSVTRQRVLEAGGKVDGFIAASLGWANLAKTPKTSTDDLDLHLYGPSGIHIFFSQKEENRIGGKLDVDMNNDIFDDDKPVENICIADESKMLEGTYIFTVHNYRRRGTGNSGFVVDVKIGNQLLRLEYDRPLDHNTSVNVLTFNYSRKDGVTIVESIGDVNVHTAWNLKTNTWVPVKMITKSPNRWNGGKGGKEHVFFFLEGCQNQDPYVKGLSQEFLRQDLKSVHSRVFQLLSSRMEVQDTDPQNQLSGIGISEAQTGHFYSRVDGRIFKVVY